MNNTPNVENSENPENHNNSDALPVNTGRETSSVLSQFLVPHRLVLAAILMGFLFLIVTRMQWDWIPQYAPKILQGVGVSIGLLFSSVILGFFLAVGLGLAQVAGPVPIRMFAGGFCTIIRGTPLLLQMWMIYYGLGSLFVHFPEIRGTWMWPYLREAWPFAVLSLTLSFAGYEGEIMRGALAGVPKGELEAARAYGMSPFQVLRRIWLPRAIRRALPTLTGETILQLKSTPLAATITVIDVYAVIGRVRQDTFITYEPLLLLAAVYMLLTGILILAFRWFEQRVPG